MFTGVLQVEHWKSLVFINHVFGSWIPSRPVILSGLSILNSEQVRTFGLTGPRSREPAHRPARIKSFHEATPPHAPGSHR